MLPLLGSTADIQFQQMQKTLEHNHGLKSHEKVVGPGFR